MRIVRRVLSPVAVLAAFAVGAWALRWVTDGSWEAVSGGRPSFDALLTFVACALAWACFAWLALSFLLVGLSAVPGALGRACGSLAESITPAVCRRIARLALGVSVVAGPVLGTMPANAATVEAPTSTSQSINVDRPVVGLPNVDRPMTEESTAARTNPAGPMTHSAPPSVDRPVLRDPVTRAPTRHDVRDETHVVKRGDTLWDIAKNRLPEGASSAEITAEWHRWYDANRDVIGDDPDLILPGQVLTPPTDRA